ncbi:hypothetical protein V502_00807 [Pseudogymnoascus sp. VKM F-4520 (FW-2644)]|nr:hypothetical protein V502_00807 [Pseudogymnoascus sp. VKM F-4520 (FW-2644)]
MPHPITHRDARYKPLGITRPVLRVELDGSRVQQEVESETVLRGQDAHDGPAAVGLRPCFDGEVRSA